MNDRTGRRAVIALGANLGNPQESLREAVAELRSVPGFSLTSASAIFRTAPVGGPDQPDYLNAVVVGEWSGTPDELLEALHAIENAHGRTRDIRWGPRTLDLDVIALGDYRSNDEHLTVPHPRAWERAFVLVPWLDAEPDAYLDGYGSVCERLSELDVNDVVEVGSL